MNERKINTSVGKGLRGLGSEKTINRKRVLYSMREKRR